MLNVSRKHLESIKPEFDAGACVMGGAYLEEPPKEGETPKMKGSVMIMVANSQEEVLKRLRSDIYTSSGVWDIDKVQIFPFKTALRSAA